MSRFRFFGMSHNDKNQGRDNMKSKESPAAIHSEKKSRTHTRSMTPIIEYQSMEGASPNSQKSCDDLELSSKKLNVPVTSNNNSNVSSDSSSCDAPLTNKENTAGKTALDETSVTKSAKSAFRRSKTYMSKDQRLKQMEKEVLEKDRIIRNLNEEIARLTGKLDLLETSVREKTLNEKKKLKNRRLPDVSSEANPGSLASLSASLVKHPKSASVRDFLIKTISTNEYLAHHDVSQIKEIVACMYRIGVNNGEILTTENDDGSTLYIVTSGVFDIYKENVKQGSLFSSDCLGETMVLCKSSLKTTCIAASDDCVVWALDRKTYKGIMLKSKMKLQSDYANLLRQVQIFAQLPDTLILNIISIVQELMFERDEYIYRIGELGTSFYIVKEGSVNIYKKTTKQAHHATLVKKLGRGSQFGENVLMIHERYVEDAKSGEHGCTVLSIECDDFNNLLGFEEFGMEAAPIESVNGPVHHTAQPPAYFRNNTVQNKPISPSRPLKLENRSFSTQQSYKAERENDQNIKLEELKSVCTVAHCSISQLEIAYQKSSPSNLFLLKQFKKKKIVDANLQEKIMAEKRMLMTCNSPFIVRLHRTFKDRKYLYMLLEGCSGGDLASLLHDSGLFPELHARFYVGCVIEALSFLHKHSIIFRSIKPESILIDDKGYAKVADLGNAKKVGNSKRTYTFTGKAEYVAPEIILNKGYDTSVDFWALGILIFELTSGHVPFKANDPMKTYNLILKGFENMVFPVSISRNAIRLIRRLCKPYPTERIGYSKGSWSEVKKNQWFENFDWIKLSKKEFEPPIKPNVLDRIEILNDLFVKDDEIPPDEMSGWDKDF